MTIEQVIKFAREMATKSKCQGKYWYEEVDYREERMVPPARLPDTDPKQFVGTADSTLQLYGYTGNVIIRAIDTVNGWMYCEAPGKEVNLHYQERQYGPNGRGDFGGMLNLKTVVEYIPILYDLDTFQSHSLETRLEIPVDHNLNKYSITLLRAMLNQSLAGDKIIQWLIMENPRHEESPEDYKRLKIRTKNTGGRAIWFDDRPVTIQFVVSNLLE